eukprot:CAMPEP_0115037948 /NCGR_PEP_ID=MMETSP0216-20121206/43109_1 /TAXON_ID=223996 /ORGANISM="Protocruzia adherens, Strain Boccale" /LENGTH=283 /DNA_ID=CAMNT_0002418239 /DNA_START=73 /DNA_END=921 /DNA_ORIENTATION=+
MPPKKVAKAMEEDDSTEKLLRIYKRKCGEEGIPPIKRLVESLNLGLEEGNHMETLYLWEEIGPLGFKPIMETLKDIRYVHCKSIRLWKANVEDEGARLVALFLEANVTVKCLEFMDCKLTNLGYEGICHLAVGLRANSQLTHLELQHCGFDQGAVTHLVDIIVYKFSALTFLNLQGNYLRNEGIINFFHMLPLSKSLKQLSVADNRWNEDDQVLDKLCSVFLTNTGIEKYDVRYNQVEEKGGNRFLETLKEATHITGFEISENMSPELFKDLLAVTTRKKKKG